MIDRSSLHGEFLSPLQKCKLIMITSIKYMPTYTHIQGKKKTSRSQVELTHKEKFKIVEGLCFITICFVLFCFVFRQLSFDLFHHTHGPFELVQVIPSFKPLVCNNLNTFYIV